MDIVTNIEGAFERVEAYVKNLLDNGAPHQQQHATDVKMVLDTARTQALPDTQTPQIAQLQDDLNDANAKITNLQGSIDSLMDVRDSLQTQLDAANAKVKALEETDNATIAELRMQLAALPTNAPAGALSAAAEPVGGRIASDPSLNPDVVPPGVTVEAKL